MSNRSSSILDAETAARLHRWRTLKDKIARYGIAIGGTGVIFAIVLIFFYLFYVVFPMLLPASIEKVADYPVPAAEGGANTLHLAIDESNTMAVRYGSDGQATFFNVADGKIVDSMTVTEHGVSSLALGTTGSDKLALGLDDGTAVLLETRFKVSYPDDVRTITPLLEYPYSNEPVEIDEQGMALIQLAMRDSDDQLVIGARTADERVILANFTKESSFLSDEVSLERSAQVIDNVDIDVAYILINPEQDRLYLADSKGELLHFNIRDPEEVQLVERIHLVASGKQVTSLRFLTGGISLLVGSSDGSVSQWFPIRDEHNNYSLKKIRSFDEQAAPVADIAAEQRRKGFLVADTQGRVGVYHSTAERTLLVESLSEQPLRQLAVSPRADMLLAESADGLLHAWRIHNEHPEISWHSLWEKVHYEGYEKPEYIWQSSSASNDFEPKFSLTPLSFGTLKAAFYAMLFAVPLAILGAIYTAYFMTPAMRKLVKPTIEIMEALPTVILGFLAGLWLAPLIEEHLPGIFALLVLMPLGVLLFGYVWQSLPARIRTVVPVGWEAALLIPIIIFTAWGSIAISPGLEHLFFNGDMRAWLYNDLGVNFDQRNSVVVGIAMGFAVIPTIFSITEDAIFSVPKHLTFGSLALGASPWQTLSRVVILTASPGIFSAVMIGLGRAVGETMIVLMATGNTPIMDMNIFEGMRTLSANIAVEMPESEVDSSHYRILFLAALVLFIFTFVFNTMAEIVRHRLRRKYSSL